MHDLLVTHILGKFCVGQTILEKSDKFMCSRSSHPPNLMDRLFQSILYVILRIYMLIHDLHRERHIMFNV